MISSEKVDQIIPAMTAALAKLEDVEKKRTAHIQTKSGVSYEYSYADLSDVLDAARPALHEHGLVVVQEAFTDASGTAVSTTFLHSSGQWIESRPLRLPVGSDAQSHGSSITYGRRYQLVALLGLATEDDDGAAARPAPVKASRQQASPRAAQRSPGPEGGQSPQPPSWIKALNNELLRRGTDETEGARIAAEAVGHAVPALADLTKDEANRVIARLRGES